jgi:hypothetical protein
MQQGILSTAEPAAVSVDIRLTLVASRVHVQTATDKANADGAPSQLRNIAPIASTAAGAHLVPTMHSQAVRTCNQDLPGRNDVAADQWILGVFAARQHALRAIKL